MGTTQSWDAEPVVSSATTVGSMTGASRPPEIAGLAASTLLKTSAGNFLDMCISSHLVVDNSV